MPGSITVVEYHPEWPLIFVEEKRLIRGTVGEHVRSIHHVGNL